MKNAGTGFGYLALAGMLGQNAANAKANETTANQSAGRGPFGRLPTSQGNEGRDHNITGYPMWLAGAGVKKGFSHGASDEYGTNAVEAGCIRRTSMPLYWH